jgi:transposase
MAARVELREIRNEEGNRLPRIVRRESGSVLSWRRAQVLVLAAQRMPPARIAELVFSDPDTVRELLPNFNREGFDALYPRYRGGRARRFRLPERQQIKRVALRVPSDLGQPFATWSLAKLADYLVAEEVLTDSSHAGLRQLLRQEGVGLQALRTWKRSNEPEFEAKKNRILELYAIADGHAEPGPGAPKVVVCSDEFGPRTIQPQPGGKAWAPRAKPRRIRATYKRPHGIRPLLCTLEVAADLLSGEVAAPKTRVEFLALCAQIRSRYPSEVRLGAPPRQRLPPQRRRSGSLGRRQPHRARPHPLLRLLAQPDRAPFKGLRYFCLAGTDHPDQQTQTKLSNDSITWRYLNRIESTFGASDEFVCKNAD